MTEREMKKLNRYQLLELLIAQTERADKLQEKVAELEARLEEHELNMSKLGSIAEAAVYISGVMEASQQAADMYLNFAKKQADDIVSYARQQATSTIAQAEERVRAISGLQQKNSNITAGKHNADGKEA